MLEITVYTRTVCGPCFMTKKKLQKHGLAYTEKNVEKDEAAAQFLRDAGYTEAPVVMTSDGREWTGFRPDLIEEIAKEAGLAEGRL
ncbi:thioredoxin domain [Arthrobacter phage Elezi]|uniref:NrdH-like glutaredoxin n=1 Tax=Arthrobacter phage Elezi TaxID=2762410 RepID=A0A7G8LH12_9CAUD|nr:thioredoxin domain [Arthrobacter phage Elezi]QNJ56534.1 NrdH-like glutaredoxin [Arthrobacter phage Elezi]QOP64337.1 NrdH-like glutaredoxin [Arthrobacter phage London]